MTYHSRVIQQLLDPPQTCCKHCPDKHFSTSSGFLSDMAKGDGKSVPTFDRFVLQGSPFVRLAGLSGAAAVALGAYGAHCKLDIGFLNTFSIDSVHGYFSAFTAEKQEMKRVYDTANFYHFVHTMALCAVPLARRPMLVRSSFHSSLILARLC